MATTKRGAATMTGWRIAIFSTARRISGGWSETELNELAVIPYGRPSALNAVTTVTPVANRPSSWRNSGASMSGRVTGASEAGTRGKGLLARGGGHRSPLRGCGRGRAPRVAPEHGRTGTEGTYPIR